jgi:meso-butanediol dehydrogenase / (S,S)-butanediol dehydrogenase / diacetyl reductase
MTGRLVNKVALVTGATSGIGEATALAMAEEGARLLLTGRDAARGTAVEAAARAKGAEAQFVAADLRKAGDAERLVAAAVERLGRLDVLVNNAGVAIRHRVDTCTDEEWAAVMETNVTAVFRLCRAAVPAMRAQGGGVIVNVASDWALVGGRNAFAYCASKGAVAQMTRAMALDHAREGIRVNAICPGDTATPMLASGAAVRAGAATDWLKALGEDLPLGRVAQPAEIARGIVFLASDDAAIMTGSMLVMDAGNTAG